MQRPEAWPVGFFTPGQRVAFVYHSKLCWISNTHNSLHAQHVLNVSIISQCTSAKVAGGGKFDSLLCKPPHKPL